MNSNNPALTKLLIANIIGYLAAKYSTNKQVSLARSLQHVLDSELYQKLIDPETVLYSENILILYEQI